MPGYKRKRDELEYSDDDDDELSFGRQILPVANLPDDFDAPPADGMQYLFTVRRNARSLPHVTRAPNPYEISSIQRSQIDNRVIPSHIVVPSEEWRALFGTRFKNFRKNVNQPTIGVPLGPSERQRLMPDKKERALWWAYLTGKSETEWNPSKRKASFQRRPIEHDEVMDGQGECKWQESWQTNDEGEVELVLLVDPSESLPTPAGSPTHPDDGTANAPCALEKAISRPREPQPCILRHIDQQTALHLLMYFTHWINLHVQKQDPEFRPVESHARWIFALLGKVGDQLSGDDMSLLRNLARACIALLKDLYQKDQEPENGDGRPMGMRSCWIIIATIVGVWAQHDLWIDAEDVLKSPGW